MKNTTAAATKFVILTPSAYIANRLCLIGEGDTAAKAWTDAYGPKPWGKNTTRSAKSAWAKEVTLDELHELHVDAAG